MKCKKDKCEICDNGEEKQVGVCTEEGILYQLKCKECGKTYYGESSRSIAERHKEHEAGQKNKDINNALWKHDHNDHEGRHQEYDIKIVGREKKAIRRQIREKIMIERNIKEGPILNSKNEWGGPPYLGSN